MNRDSSFDDRMAAWLADEAPAEAPDRLIRATFERTRGSRQARAHPFQWPRPLDLRLVGLSAAAAAIVLTLVIGAGVVRTPVGPGSSAPSPSVGTASPTPSAGAGSSAPSAAALPTSRIPPLTGLPGRIAFSRPNTRPDFDTSSDIFVMNPDRTGLRQLTTAAGSNRQPAWSPDGTKLAFVSNRDGRRAIWVMNADGSDQVRLTPPDIIESADPAWSPSGSIIAFSRGRPDLPADTDGIYLINADGTNLRPLLVVGEHEMTVASQPLWSPDGSTILVRGELDLFLIGIDGSNFRNLTNTPASEDSAGSWSPDGRWIAFEGDQGGGCVFRIKPDGTALERLTIGCSQGFSMSWAPDSSRIALAGGPHGLADISVINADGSNPQSLTDTHDVAEIAWGP